MLRKFYLIRFEIFFFSLLTILFGSLVVPSVLYENIVSPILFQMNLIAGILLVSGKKKLMWFLIILLIIKVIISGSNLLDNRDESVSDFVRLATYFLFYLVVTFEMIKQVWNAEKVDKNVIYGLVSGYISLGLIGLFICLTIEFTVPNSFQGLLTTSIQPESLTDGLMYYSYITLMTIGYGDVIPATALAHKATMLIGLMGQIYIVVITAIVVGKYIKQSTEN